MRTLAGVVLARHGETPFNAEGRFQGHLPVPLTERGRDQAAALAQEAAQRTWGSYWCSPLERARETAAIVGDAIGMEPVVDARLAETDCGDWSGRSFAEVQAEDPEGFAAFDGLVADFAFPGGESFAAQTERVLEVLTEIHAAGPLPALVVCHRNVMRLALIALTGDEAWRTTTIANAGLLELP